MARADFVTALGLIALAVGALVESLNMPRFENLSVNPYTVPGIVPALLSAGLLVLSTILLVRSIVRGGWRLRGGGVRAWLVSSAAHRLYLSFGLTLGYAAGLVGRLPFWLATGLFLPVVLLGTLSLYLVTDDSVAFLFMLGNFFGVFLILFLIKTRAQWLHGWAAFMFGLGFLAWPWSIINAANGTVYSWMWLGLVSLATVLIALALIPLLNKAKETPRQNLPT